MLKKFIFAQEILSFVFNIMHGRGAVDFMFCFGPKYHDYSISSQSYEFCPHLAELITLIPHCTVSNTCQVVTFLELYFIQASPVQCEHISWQAIISRSC